VINRRKYVRIYPNKMENRNPRRKGGGGASKEVGETWGSKRKLKEKKKGENQVRRHSRNHHTSKGKKSKMG